MGPGRFLSVSDCLRRRLDQEALSLVYEEQNDEEVLRLPQNGLFPRYSNLKLFLFRRGDQCQARPQGGRDPQHR